MMYFTFSVVFEGYCVMCALKLRNFAQLAAERAAEILLAGCNVVTREFGMLFCV